MDEKQFASRLAQLRTQRGVSARDMSLSIGQNAGYINSIENEKSLPSLTGFFYICEYLGITPKEFFDTGSENPAQFKVLIEDLKALDSQQLESISALVRNMVRR